MGGGPSKPKSNKLLASVPFCKFSKIDTIYDRVNKALKSAEDVRVGVEESKLKAIELAKTNWVKGDEDLRFLEAVKILLWTVSGENGGKILSVNPRGSNEPPALELMFQAKKQETNNLYQNATSFIRAGANAKIIKEATVELEKAIKETASGSAQIKKEGKAAGMDAKAQAAAIKVVQSNTKLLKVEVLKLKSIQTAADKAVTCLKKIRVGDLISPNHIDDTGKKISTESGNTFKTPAEIFDKYYTGAKLTQKEFDAEKSGKKPAPSKGNDKNAPQKQATTGPGQNQAPQNNATNAGQPNNNQPTNQNSNQQGAPNQNITNNQNQSYGDSPFKNQQGGNNTMQNTPQKGKIQDEDIWDDEENKGPIIKNVQDSNLLHQSSIKRQKYIKPIV